MAASTTTSIKLDDAVKARLQQLAIARRRSVHWLMREAIAEFVAREEERALTAWTDFQALQAAAQTESSAKTEEAYAWLAQLEAKGVSTKPSKWRG